MPELSPVAAPSATPFALAPKPGGPPSMTAGPVGATLARLTLPMLGALLAMIGYSVAETWFIARLGPHAIAAVSFTFPVTMAVISLAIGLGAGTSAVVARALGTGEAAAGALVIDAMLLTAMVAGVITAYLAIVPVSYGAAGIIAVANSAFNGLNRPGAAVLISVARTMLVNVPVAWLGGRLLGAHGVFLGVCAANLLVGAWAALWVWRATAPGVVDPAGNPARRAAAGLELANSSKSAKSLP